MDLNEKKYINSLLLSQPLREPLIKEVLEDLDLPDGSHGLDAGCGIGLQCIMLAERIGRKGKVSGIDMSGSFISYAEDIVEKSGLADCITLKKGDIRSLPFKDSSFDWIWSMDCAGFIPGDKTALLDEFLRVLNPGGFIILLIWSSQLLLPGYPELESRLNSIPQGIAPFKKGMAPNSHYLRALGWFRQVGLKNVKAHTYIHTINAPVSNDIKLAMADLFFMRWGDPNGYISPEETELYRRLSRPDSPEFIVDEPSYYAYFTYTLFKGQKPV